MNCPLERFEFSVRLEIYWKSFSLELSSPTSQDLFDSGCVSVQVLCRALPADKQMRLFSAFDSVYLVQSSVLAGLWGYMQHTDPLLLPLQISLATQLVSALKRVAGTIIEGFSSPYHHRGSSGWKVSYAQPSPQASSSQRKRGYVYPDKPFSADGATTSLPPLSCFPYWGGQGPHSGYQQC